MHLKQNFLTKYNERQLLVMLPALLTQIVLYCIRSIIVFCSHSCYRIV